MLCCFRPLSTEYVFELCDVYATKTNITAHAANKRIVRSPKMAQSLWIDLKTCRLVFITTDLLYVYVLY